MLRDMALLPHYTFASCFWQKGERQNPPLDRSCILSYNLQRWASCM